MRQELIVIGAGGGSQELLGFISEINAARPPAQQWRVRGVLDDDPEQEGRSVAGYPVIGALADLAGYPHARVVIGIANAARVTIRRAVYRRLRLKEERYATLIHPRACVAPTAVLEPGCVIYPGVCVGPHTTIGTNSVVYFNAVIHHDASVGAHSAICAGVCLAGHVTLGECSYVGAAASVRDGVEIGAETLIGMGAVVTKRVGCRQVVYGVPARPRPRATALCGVPGRR